MRTRRPAPQMPDITIRFVDDVAVEGRSVRRLGEEVLGRRRDPDLAAWLQREMKARALPAGDTIPLKNYSGSPAKWLHREAESWCDYVGYVQGQIDHLDDQVAHLAEPQRTSSQRQLAAARADWTAARIAWELVTDL
jgi:hypothetical protein